MAIEWYLQDLRDQHGPLGTAELKKKLASYANLDNVLIWREGFQNWKSVAEVFDAFDSPAELNQRRRVKGRWALYGLILGILLHASDVAFEWRGEPFHPWNGHEFENIDRAAASLVIPAFLFFLAGTIKDIFFSRSKIQAAVAEAAQQVGPGRTAHGHTNFIARNWRGEYPLPVSYWVFGLIGNFAVALIPLGLAAVYDAKMGFQPVYLFAFILSVWLLSIGISVWQWVGIWRSANRYIERKSLKLERALGRCRKADDRDRVPSARGSHRHLGDSAGQRGVAHGFHGRSRYSRIFHTGDEGRDRGGDNRGHQIRTCE